MSVPDILRSARRYIEDYDWIKLLEDWQEDKESSSWYLHLSIHIDISTHLFPSDSEWYFIADNAFPSSEVKVFPSVKNSIQTTLYHQAKNDRIADNGLWRLGDICIRENTLSELSHMPYGSEELLIVSIIRTRQWLEAAAKGTLIQMGDRFELPSFRPSNCKNLIYKEDEDSFEHWQSMKVKVGLVRLHEHEINEFQYYRPSIFFDLDNNYIFRMDWGSYFTKFNEPSQSTIGISVLLNEVPVIRDWQSPSTFKELIAVAKRNNINLLDELKNCIVKNEKKFRDGERHFLLIGFPVPEFFGSENVQIVWVAIWLPRLTGINGKVINGFRCNEKGRWETDKRTILKPDIMIDWCDCNNWDSTSILQRGSLPSDIAEMRVLIIGAGCVGAMVAELLVREGVSHIAVVDDDTLQVGNLTRHTLTINDLELYKADSLCKHLAEINPNVSTKAFIKKITEESDLHTFGDYNLIIDCSASPQVLRAVSNINCEKEIFFASISLSLGAQQFFIALKRGCHFEFDDYANVINSYTDASDDIDPNTFPRDGIGCWHPAFPARMDDIVMGAAISVKTLEDFIEDDNRSSVVLVYSKKQDGYCSTFHIVEEVSTEQL